MPRGMVLAYTIVLAEPVWAAILQRRSKATAENRFK